MSTGIKVTPSLSTAEFIRFSKELEANRHNRISIEEKTRIRKMVQGVLKKKK